jgi:uncharacterized protein (DUF2062 family)
MVSGFNSRLARWYQRFIKLRGSPHALAGGMALGLFIGMSPFFGLHVLTALALAALLKWSKITALIGVNITNALTAPLIYPLNYWVGALLAGRADHIQWPSAFNFGELIDLLRQSPQIILNLVIGGIAIGLPLSLLGYGVTLKLIMLYRGRRDAGGRRRPAGRPGPSGRTPRFSAGRQPPAARGPHPGRPRRRP